MSFEWDIKGVTEDKKNQGASTPGPEGDPGADGVGLNYQWQGAQLGIKREDESSYTYVDLRGPQGESGPQGPPGEVVTYIHTQIAPSTIWAIQHNLGRYPSVSVVDSAGSLVLGETKYLSEQEIELSFSAAFAGKAYLN